MQVTPTTQWQSQDHEPSTVLNVKIVGQKSVAANCTSSANQQYDAMSNIHHHPMSYRTVNPVQLGIPVRHHATYAGSYPPRVCLPTGTVEGFTEVPASPRQTMVNTRVIRNDGLPQDRGFRDSILAKLGEELQQQKTYSRNQPVMKPVAVKAQSNMQGFRPLMSSPSHVPSSTVSPSSAQILSGQIALSVFHLASKKRTAGSADEVNFNPAKRSAGSSQPCVHKGQMISPGSAERSPMNFSPAKRSPGSSLPNVRKGQMISPGSAERSPMWHPCLSDSQNVNISQSVPFGSPLASRRYTASGECMQGSHYSPTGQSFNAASYYSEPMPLSSTLSPQQVPSQICAVGVPETSLSPGFCHDLRSVYGSRVSMFTQPHESSGSVGFPSKSTSAGYSASQKNLAAVNCLQLSSSPCNSSVSSATSIDKHMSGAPHRTAIVPMENFTSSCSAQMSAPGLRNYRMGMADQSKLLYPSSSQPNPRSIPRTAQMVHEQSKQSLSADLSKCFPSSCSQQKSRSIPGTMQIASQQPKRTMSVLPPARAPRNVSNQIGHRQPSNMAGFDHFVRPPSQQGAHVETCKTVSSTNPLSATVSLSKFFVHGSLDLDAYLGKLLGDPLFQTSVKSERSASSAPTAKIGKKCSSPMSAGVKTKLQKPAHVELCKTVSSTSSSPLCTTISPSKSFVHGSIDLDTHLRMIVHGPRNPTEQSASSVATELVKTGKKSSSMVCAGVKSCLLYTSPSPRD